MKKTIFLFFAVCFIIGNLSAQKTKTTTTKNKTKSTVTKSKAFEIPADAYTITGNDAEDKTINTDYEKVVITGNNNKIKLTGKYTEVIVTGKDNDIEIVSVNKIVVSGKGNFISWEKSTTATGKPSVQDTGGYNNVGKKSGDAMDKNDN